MTSDTSMDGKVAGHVTEPQSNASYPMPRGRVNRSLYVSSKDHTSPFSMSTAIPWSVCRR